MKAVIPTRKEVVEACCYLNEAERSLHHVLNPACRWHDFLAYYTPDKVAALKRFVDVFQPQAAKTDNVFPVVAELARWYRPPGVFRHFLGACVGRFRSRWRVLPEEAAFIGAVFAALVRILAEGEKPHADRLIAARMATCSAHQIIEVRCSGLHELKTVRQRIGWFNRLPHQPTLTVAEILRDVA